MDHAAGVDRTALVVDDDVFMLSALAELLEEEGYDVHTASNGFSALRQVQSFRPGRSTRAAAAYLRAPARFTPPRASVYAARCVHLQATPRYVVRQVAVRSSAGGLHYLAPPPPPPAPRLHSLTDAA